MERGSEALATPRTIAYFSMEIGLEASIPTYSGGLGVLAGDTLRAAADMGLPMVAVTLLHRKGYFRQRLDDQGNQSEENAVWSPEDALEPLTARADVRINGRMVGLRAWRYVILGVRGHVVPVYFLDAALPDNDPDDQALTDHLYGGDLRYRLCQEALLGFGGVAMLEALGHRSIRTYHMNEGHSALLGVALLERQMGSRDTMHHTPDDHENVRRCLVFTTHTPIAAGHDRFPKPLAEEVLGEDRIAALEADVCLLNGELNMTFLALRFSRYINGVSMRHEQISQDMFPRYPINSITNGVHAVTWAASSFRRLFDSHIPEWRHDSRYLRYAVSVPLDEVRDAHVAAKRHLFDEVERRTGVKLDPAVLTIGFARRAAAYKRADLLFADLDRLRRIAAGAGPLQIVYGGKAHPRDEGGKELIRRIFAAGRALGDSVRVVYVEEYDIALAKRFCSGVDVWLNTPWKPHEASGTSGMKAAINGVPSLSVLDGWWIEGHVEGVTGWSVDESWKEESDSAREATELYNKLENVIAPMYYTQPEAFAAIMRSAITLNGSFFNSQRMLSQYVLNAYQPDLVL